MSDDTLQPDAEDRITRERREHAMMKAALEEIANYQMPDDDGMEEDDDGFTEWGVGREEAIEMAYENVIETAKFTLNKLA